MAVDLRGMYHIRGSLELVKFSETLAKEYLRLEGAYPGRCIAGFKFYAKSFGTPHINYELDIGVEFEPELPDKEKLGNDKLESRTKDSDIKLCALEENQIPIHDVDRKVIDYLMDSPRLVPRCEVMTGFEVFGELSVHPMAKSFNLVFYPEYEPLEKREEAPAD